MIAESLTPALKKLDAFIKETYLPACRKDVGASSLPDGEAFYQYSIRRQTTTDLTAKQIHEIGLKEVARIRREMEDVIRGTGFKGSFAEFLTFLRTDPRFYYAKAEDLVAGYSHIAKQADGKLPGRASMHASASHAKALASTWLAGKPWASVRSTRTPGNRAARRRIR